MSRIDELILKYCPNGVEFKKLGDIAEYRRGSFPQPYGNAEWYDGEGAMPFVQVADVAFDMKLVKNTKQKISLKAQTKSIFVPKNTVVVTLQGSIGRVAITQYDAYVDRTLAIFLSYKFEINLKYFAYQLESKFKIEREFARGSTLKTITKEEFTKFMIPIPPLAVQEEIVKILDKFTQLEAELEAELEARTRQYEYYRNQLLAFEDKEVEWKTLGEVGEFIRGSGLQKTDFTESGVGCIHYGQIYTFYGTYATKTKSFVSEELAKKLRKAKKGDLIIAGVSENIEDVCKSVVWLGEEDICISGDSSAFRHNQNSKFIGYLLQTSRFSDFKKKFAQGAKVTRLRSGSLPTFKIPIPPIEEQERIVKILDQFDALVNDISVGLPAEIKARREQYEYYRGKLLTFKPLVHS
ncbi:MAG: restriction endonuclease subunit S [Chryseobacterium sp.]|nr:restriction endonuclease subunit S [Chryseobacterium sp.]